MIRNPEKMKLVSGFLACVAAHGRLMEPPGRSSLYHFPTDPDIAAEWDKIVPNYNDNQLFCGGFSVQVSNGYRCGVCGDNFIEPRPRDNELGGRYGSSGIIPREYRAGDRIPLTVQITAHHLGWFEFRLCKYEGGLEDDQCFIGDDSLIKFVDGSTRHYITTEFPQRRGKAGYWYELEVILPDIECEHCVLQWRYHCGNNWGTDSEGTGIGYGLQEEFYGCADIKVTKGDSEVVTIKPSKAPTSTIEPTVTTATTEPTAPPTVTTTSEVPNPNPTNKPTNFCTGKESGLYKHGDCEMFYQCFDGITYERSCPPGLRYNPKYGFCDWAVNVQC